MHLNCDDCTMKHRKLSFHYFKHRPNKDYSLNIFLLFQTNISPSKWKQRNWRLFSQPSLHLSVLLNHHLRRRRQLKPNECFNADERHLKLNKQGTPVQQQPSPLMHFTFHPCDNSCYRKRHKTNGFTVFVNKYIRLRSYESKDQQRGRSNKQLLMVIIVSNV